MFAEGWSLPSQLAEQLFGHRVNMFVLASVAVFTTLAAILSGSL
jgi:hypothetical protein